MKKATEIYLEGWHKDLPKPRKSRKLGMQAPPPPPMNNPRQAPAPSYPSPRVEDIKADIAVILFLLTIIFVSFFAGLFVGLVFG